MLNELRQSLRTETIFRRTAALLAVASALMHLLMLGHGSIVWGLIMATMALVCFPCAGHLWRFGSRKLWLTIGVMNAAMVAVHAWLLVSADVSHHQHDATAGANLAAESFAHASHGHGGEGFIISLSDNLFYVATVIAAVEAIAAIIALTIFRYGGPASSEASVRRCAVAAL